MSNLNNSQYWQQPQQPQQQPLPQQQLPQYATPILQQQQLEQSLRAQQMFQLQMIQQQQQLALQQLGIPVKLYIKPGDDIRKFRVAVNGPWNLQVIKNKVIEYTSKNPEFADAKFSLSYLDEEADWIRLENDDDWKEFVSTQRPVIKIKAKCTFFLRSI